MPNDLRLTCLSPEAREFVLSEMRTMPAATRATFTKLINAVAECPSGQSVGVAVGGAGKGGKTKRAPSAYNNFVGGCMKSGKNMKDCSAEWKARGKR